MKELRIEMELNHASEIEQMAQIIKKIEEEHGYTCTLLRMVQTTTISKEKR